MIIENQISEVLPLKQDGEISNIKNEKINYALNFSKSLPKKGVLFIGISGSVSYDPGRFDDVDLFVITRNGSLWAVLLTFLIKRRILGFKDICLSLNLDNANAKRMYMEELTPLRRSDAFHVIPIFGEEYYNSLLELSYLNGKTKDKRESSNLLMDKETRLSGRAGNLLLFFLLSPLLYLKALFVSHREQKGNLADIRFDSRLSSGYFYFDSQKYRQLSLKIEEENIGNLFSGNILK